MNFFHTLSKHVQLNVRGYILLPFACFFLYLCLYFSAISISIHTTLSRNEGKSADFTGWISNLGGRVGWSIDIALALISFVVFAYFAANIGIIVYRNKKRYTSHGTAHFITTIKELLDTNFIDERSQPRLWLGVSSRRKIGLTYEQQSGDVLLVGDPYASLQSVILPAITTGETGLRSFLLVDTDGQIQKKGEHLRNWYTWHDFDVHQPSFLYNPLGYIRSVEDAKNFSVCWLANTEGVNDHLSSLHLLLTATVLHLVQTTSQTPPLYRIAELLGTTPLPALRTLLSQSPSQEARNVAGAFFTAHQQEAEAALLLAELNTRLLLLHEKEVQHVTSTNTLHFSALSEQPCALVLHLQKADGKKYSPLTACLVMHLAQIMRKQQRQFPFAFYLPRLVEIGYVPHILEHLSAKETAFIMGIQHYEELCAIYGEEDARQLREYVRTHVLFRSCQDGRYYSLLAGTKTVLKPSVRRPDRRSFWRRMIEGPYLVEKAEPLLSAEEVKLLDPDEVLILRRDAPPVRAKKTQ